MQKWEIAGKKFSNERPFKTKLSQQPPAVMQSLSGLCILQLAKGTPDEVFTSLKKLEGRSHLYGAMVEAFCSGPSKTWPTHQLRLWVERCESLLQKIASSRGITFDAFEKEPSPTDLETAMPHLARPIKRLRRLAQDVLARETCWTGQADEIEDSMRCRVAGQQARRHMAYLKKLGW